MNDERWLTARRHRGFERVFGQYILRLVRRSFAAVWIARDAAPLPSGGYIAVANHTSWWDGFLPYVVHRTTHDAGTFAIMMEDRELRRFPIFRWAGAFSVGAGTTRSAYPAVRYAAEQAQNGCGVWLYPEGRFVHAGEDAPFTSGFVHAARIANAGVVPVALRVAMLERQRPEAFLDIREAVDATRIDAREVVRRIVRERTVAIDGSIARRDRTRFRPLLLGTPGVDAIVSSLLRPFRR